MRSKKQGLRMVESSSKTLQRPQSSSSSSSMASSLSIRSSNRSKFYSSSVNVIIGLTLVACCLQSLKTVRRQAYVLSMILDTISTTAGSSNSSGIDKDAQPLATLETAATTAIAGKSQQLPSTSPRLLQQEQPQYNISIHGKPTEQSNTGLIRPVHEWSGVERTRFLRCQ
mmetsp:Transcript_4596/g.11682  ORF Transcript_4596/g.11682 Transcript_4596/m.11682 type:complete len:170 (-) Transcript_4596:590-1099(-)